MSKIFISHSSLNNAPALAVAQWLEENGWHDYFLDITPDQGLSPGERWQEALKKAADRCEVVLCLLSSAWRNSEWCSTEFLLAKQLGKRIIGVLIEPLSLESLPRELTGEWQLADLSAGTACQQFVVHHDPLVPKEQISFSSSGLLRLKFGLNKAGLDPSHFLWPPKHDPARLPYRGLKALEPDDAAVYFGRDAAIVRGLDELRLMRDKGIEQLFVILGASGAGKSSFLRAGLWPRLERDDYHFLPLPVIRPERHVITGTMGLVVAMETAFEKVGGNKNRGDLRETIDRPGGFPRLLMELQQLSKERLPLCSKFPTIVLSVDQGEELFGIEGRQEAEHFLELLAEGLSFQAKVAIAIISIRSDSYDLLQTTPYLVSLKHHPFNLKPLACEEYKAVIEEPGKLIHRGLKIDPALTERLLDDAAGADALPLLAFTLERLFLDYGKDGDLRLSEYMALGGIRGSIEAVVKVALACPHQPPAIPQDSAELDQLVHKTFIPWLAGVDPETGLPTRRVACREDLGSNAQPLLDRLIQARLLVQDQRLIDDTQTITTTVEIAHEALLRQWPTLTSWLDQDADLLKTSEVVRRAAAEWGKHERNHDWLAHRGERLQAAENLRQRPDLWAMISFHGQAYVAACREAEDHAAAEHEAHLKRIEQEQNQRAAAQAYTARFQRRSSLLLTAIALLLVTGGFWIIHQTREVAHQTLLVLATSAKRANDAGRHDEALRLAMLGAAPGWFAPATAEIETQLARGAHSSTLRAQLVGHEGPVSIASFSPDGSKVLTASWDKTARLWDVSTGGEIMQYRHESKVNSAMFTPDGTRLITSAADNSVVMWDVATGKPLQTLSGHKDAVYISQFSRDGDKLLTTSWDKTARLWDVNSGKELTALVGHEDRVYSAALSPDETKVVTASWDKTARLWDAVTGKPIAVLKGHRDRLFSANFSPDGTMVVTASRDRTARLWNGSTGREIATLIGHNDPVITTAFSPDGTKIVTASSDDSARVWNVSTGKELTTLSGHKGEVKSAVFSPDGSTILTASSDDSARLWNAATGKEIAAFIGHGGMVRSAAFNRRGTQVVTTSRDKMARVWDVPAVLEVAKYRHEAPVNSAVFSRDSATIVTTSEDKVLRLWDLTTSKEPIKLMGHDASVDFAVFNPAGTQIVSASRDKTARIWDVRTRKTVATLVGHDAPVNSVAFNLDGSKVVTASGDLDTSDHTARVWEVNSGREVARFIGHDDRVFSAEFSPDGTKILTTSWDGTARLWNLATGKELVKYRHDGRINSGMFSSDGTHIVTASSDRTARIWETKTGKELTSLVGHDGPVNSAEFSPDGTKIVTASADRTARLWEISTGNEIAKLDGHEGAVLYAIFSTDGTRAVTASADRTARVWDLQWLASYHGQDLVERVCRDKLVGARHITAQDVEGRPVLSGREGEDVCNPPSFFSRIANILRFGA